MILGIDKVLELIRSSNLVEGLDKDNINRTCIKGSGKVEELLLKKKKSR